MNSSQSIKNYSLYTAVLQLSMGTEGCSECIWLVDFVACNVLYYVGQD